MNTTELRELWWPTFGLLALEGALIVLVAAGLARRMSSAFWRRTILQSAFLALLALVFIEGQGGLRSRLASMESVNFASEAPPRIQPASRVVPATVAVPTHVPATTLVSETPLPPVVVVAEPGVASSIARPVAAAKNSPWFGGALLVWIGGAALVLGRTFFSHALLQLWRRRGGATKDAALLHRVETLRRKMSLRCRIPVFESEHLTGPIAFGLLRPSVGLPKDFPQRHTTAQQEVMLAHELAHLSAGDPAWYLLADVATALWWWHPIVWWLRRRLHVASESAADEASLLVHDGPGVLAECLVALARQQTSPRPAGWLGIEGSGFRSGLGRRVESLLKLDGNSWRPPDRLRTTLARTLVPAALIVLIVLCTAWTLPQPPTQGDRMKTSFWNHTLAALTLTSVLASPDLPIAAAEPTVATLRPASASVEEMPATSGKTSAKLQAKLESIILDEVQFDGLPLVEVVNILIKEALKRDPEKIGVNFLMGRPTGSPPPPSIDPLTGVPLIEFPTDLNSVAIRILPPLKKVRLVDALDAITRVAEVPIKYTVEEYAVVWSVVHEPAVPPPVLRIPPAAPVAPVPPAAPAPIAPPTASVELHTRMFKIDPYTFAAGLSETLGKKSSPTNAANARQVIEDTRTLLASAGVEWTPAKSIFYNDRQGTLMVRVALRELDLVEEVVQMLNATPAQVSIEVKFCEVSAEARKALGFDWIAANPAGKGVSHPTNASDFTLTGILTDPQFRVIQRTLEQRTGVDVLTLPRLTTLSGRQAQIKAVEHRSIVTGLDHAANAAKPDPAGPFQPVAESFELGPILDVVPLVSADGFTIHLTTTATLKEFVGYDLNFPSRMTPAQLQAAFGQTNVPSTRANDPYPLPIFRLRQVATSAAVWDGQTLVLSSSSMAVQLKGHAKEPPKPEASGKTLLVFITPTIIDPAGNRVHSPTDMPFAKDTVPPQKAAQRK